MEAANDNVSARALEIGKAGEHLVCADLILQGYRAFLSDQGLPFDVVAVANDRLWRVQVKSTLQPKNVNAKGRNPRLSYSWSIRKRGKDGKGDRLTGAHCDLVALVALDTREVAYLPLSECGQTVQLKPTGSTYTSVGGPSTFDGDVSSYPFADAISGTRTYRRGSLEECPNGHPYTPENTYFSKGKYRMCRICAAESMRKRRATKEAA
ncbi:hypothetical protein [Sinorhizobium meliloti]|uniref:hypothetical protein n=1 Tax=Rhizobium meliloti TaxID=382 RepID=UPI000FD7D82A|nr:hypothetical protein [Sinorhizobium meliloti]